jgi:hypothetical protein
LGLELLGLEPSCFGGSVSGVKPRHTKSVHELVSTRNIENDKD